MQDVVLAYKSPWLYIMFSVIFDVIVIQVMYSVVPFVKRRPNVKWDVFAVS